MPCVRCGIALFGGASLFRSLLDADAGQVDTVEVSLIPVLLGAGVPLMTPADQGRGRVW